MLPLLLMLLAVAGIHSLPLQENCTETERTFHECLRKLYPVMQHSMDMEGFESQKAVFLPCGAEHSNCYLQKTLMTMIDYLTEEKEEEDISYELSCSQAKEDQQKCYEVSYNEHGFQVSWGDGYAASHKCLRKAAQSHNCSPEYIKELVKSENYFLKKHYANRLAEFFLFVRMNAALDEKAPIVFSEPLRQPKHCKRSEKIFQVCMKDKLHGTMRGNYTEKKGAFVQCGGDKSQCYLQKHLMNMVNTVINAINEPYEFDPQEFNRCEKKIKKMDSIRLECLRPGFDEHGFAKPDREFDYHKARCHADMAQRSEACSLNIVNYYKEKAIWKYEYALSEFSLYVNDTKLIK